MRRSSKWRTSVCWGQATTQSPRSGLSPQPSRRVRKWCRCFRAFAGRLRFNDRSTFSNAAMIAAAFGAAGGYADPDLWPWPTTDTTAEGAAHA